MVSLHPSVHIVPTLRNRVVIVQYLHTIIASCSDFNHFYQVFSDRFSGLEKQSCNQLGIVRYGCLYIQVASYCVLCYMFKSLYLMMPDVFDFRKTALIREEENKLVLSWAKLSSKLVSYAS